MCSMIFRGTDCSQTHTETSPPLPRRQLHAAPLRAPFSSPHHSAPQPRTQERPVCPGTGHCPPTHHQLLLLSHLLQMPAHSGRGSALFQEPSTPSHIPTSHSQNSCFCLHFHQLPVAHACVCAPTCLRNIFMITKKNYVEILASMEKKEGRKEK